LIFGVGIDIIEIHRIENEISGGKEDLLRSVFTDREVGKQKMVLKTASVLAGKFAAKEALLKALGCGLNLGFVWKDVEILDNSDGTPEACFSGKMEQYVQNNDISAVDLSLTTTREAATALAIIHTNSY